MRSSSWHLLSVKLTNYSFPSKNSPILFFKIMLDKSFPLSDKLLIPLLTNKLYKIATAPTDVSQQFWI